MFPCPWASIVERQFDRLLRGERRRGLNVPGIELRLAARKESPLYTDGIESLPNEVQVGDEPGRDRELVHQLSGL